MRLEAGLSQRALAARVGYSRQYVSMTEWEDAVLPSQELIAALDTALGANGALVDLRAQAHTALQTRRRARTNISDRTDVSRTSLTTNVFSPFNLEVVPAKYVRVTSHVGNVAWSDVDNVKEAARRAAKMDNLHGGGSATNTADRELYRFATLLRGRIATAAQRALFEAIGNLSGVAAFAAFDVADFAAAEQHARFALWCADSAGSWELRASTLADMARMTAYSNSADDALTLVELALVRSDRLSATTRAMLSALRAQFLAALGRTDQALNEVARSDEHFADRAPGEDPPWMCYYDEAEHMGSTGKALIPAALARKQIELAGPRISRAIRRQGHNYPRSRTFSLTRLATLTMRIGDPREAAAIGMQAVDKAKDLQSQRIRDELRTLARVSIKHLTIPEVDELYSTVTFDSDRKS
ncbi:helix-turn-helix domain-containing protein [Nocardia wallacei]|uniref:helix-turn-helix domain-containing protein n=1 Tax=Nocardia wallacei TaxID=480035 RepID=UPI002455425B|nr:helix-turn-helix transcriptional regulator [Nocardia wallacei]